MAGLKKPQIAPQVEFCENAKYRELRPDSARSAEIPQNPGKCKSAGGVLHKSNTATNFFIRDGRVAAWQSQVGKSQDWRKVGSQTDQHRPANVLSDLEGLALHFDFLNVGEDLGPFP